MEAIFIAVIIAIVLLYYFQKRNNKSMEEAINRVEHMSDAEYAESVEERQAFLRKIRLKNVATKGTFFYFGQGRFIESGVDTNLAKYINLTENQQYTEEFYTEPRYSIAGTYDNEYYIKYFDAKPYVSLSLLETLFFFDESKWRKVLYPIEYIEGLGYNFLEFLKLSLPERHPDDKWLEDRSSGTCNRFYFKDLTVAEILSVPN